MSHSGRWNQLDAYCQTAQHQVDGSFAITNCDSDSYAVKFHPSAGTYIKEITFNEQDAMTHPIDLSRCSGGALKIVIRPVAASVTATVRDSASSDDVVLIPDSSTHNELVAVIHLDRNEGKYSAAGLAPCHYTALATTGIDANLWQNSQFVHQLQTLGTPFDLAENEQKALAVLKLAEGETEQLELRLGLY